MEQSMQSNLCLYYCIATLAYSIERQDTLIMALVGKKYCLFLDNLHYFDLKNVSIDVISLSSPTLALSFGMHL